jgi:NAD(P)-dependent dehydrogenase (short-subunit alcohol dehydrogenase family)
VFAVARAVELLGGIDVLVTALDFRMDEPFLVMADSWQVTIDENLTNAFLVAREAARWMVKFGSGVIVHVTSAMALSSEEGSASFAAAKAGLKLMTAAMALDLAPSGVRVCAVAEPSRHDLREADFAPTPYDVASMVVFCASDQASYVVGSTVALTGEFLVRGA